MKLKNHVALVEPMYRVLTGNLFGVSQRWVESIHDAAEEIAGDDCIDSNWTCNPAFAGAWITVSDRCKADLIRSRWRSMIAMAISGANCATSYKNELVSAYFEGD